MRMQIGSRQALKKSATGMAWSSFAWFMSEPDKIFMLREGISQFSALNEQVTGQIDV